MDPFGSPTPSMSVLFAPRKAVQTELAPKVISRLQEINNHPEQNVYIHGKVLAGGITLPSEPVKYLVVADISGSNDSAATGLVNYYKRLSTDLPNGFFFPFGPQANQQHSLLNYTGLSMDRVPWEQIKPSQFNTGTYPHLMIQAISRQTSPFILLIQSDGEISNFPTFCSFLQNEGSSVMENCRGMYVLFSCHTQNQTKASVERQLTEILSSSRENAIPFEFALDHPGHSIEPLISTIREWQGSSCFTVPEEHLVWNDLIFSKHITKFQFAKLFWKDERLQIYIKKFVDQVRSLLTTNPEKAIMLRDNLAYARIYGTLSLLWGITKDTCSLYDELVLLAKSSKEIPNLSMTEDEIKKKIKDVESTRVTVAQMLLSEEPVETDFPIQRMIQLLRPVKMASELINQLRDLLSNVKAKSKGELTEILEDLLLNAREDEAEVSLALDKVTEEMVGYVEIKGTTKAEVIEMIKDGSSNLLCNWVSQGDGKIVFVSGRANLPKGAVPIAIPSADAKTHRMCLSLLFNQYSLKLNERQTFILAMLFILTPSVSPMLRRISEKAILNDGSYVARQMGLKGVFDLDPLFTSVKVSKLVNMLFVLHGEALFQGIDPQVKSMLTYTFSLFDVAYFLRNILRDEPSVKVSRTVPFVPKADSGIVLPVLKPIEKEEERRKWMASTEYAGHPPSRHSSCMTEAEGALVSRLSLQGLSAPMVITLDFGGFYAYSHRPNRTNFLAQLRRLIQRRWIESCDHGYFRSVKEKWASLGYSDIPIAENEEQALELLQIYLGKGSKIVRFIEDTVEIDFPTKSIFTSGAFRSLFPYSPQFWDLVCSANNPSYALFVEIIRNGGQKTAFDSESFPVYKIREFGLRAIYGGEFSTALTTEELQKFYAHLVQLTIARRRVQTQPKISTGSTSLGEEIFDPNLGIEYCPCCFGAFRPRVGSELSCGHMVCPECMQKMAEYAPGDFYQPWKHQCPICRTAIPYPETPYGKQLAEITLNPKMIYRFCAECSVLFECGNRTCFTDGTEFLDKCSTHQVKNRFQCPACGVEIEYAGGCLHFTCCQYGTDRCRGQNCDHGGLCGHQWTLNRDQMVITGNEVQ